MAHKGRKTLCYVRLALIKFVKKVGFEVGFKSRIEGVNCTLSGREIHGTLPSPPSETLIKVLHYVPFHVE